MCPTARYYHLPRQSLYRADRVARMNRSSRAWAWLGFKPVILYRGTFPRLR